MNVTCWRRNNLEIRCSRGEMTAFYDASDDFAPIVTNDPMRRSQQCMANKKFFIMKKRMWKKIVLLGRRGTAKHALERNKRRNSPPCRLVRFWASKRVEMLDMSHGTTRYCRSNDTSTISHGLPLQSSLLTSNDALYLSPRSRRMKNEGKLVDKPTRNLLRWSSERCTEDCCCLKKCLWYSLSTSIILLYV